MEVMSESHGLLLVLSGPAGVGKDTVWKAAAPCLTSFAKATTCTTRAQRPGEQHGVHYYFVSDADFDAMIEENKLLEWAYVHGNRYGVPVSSVSTRIERGEDVICVIDVQGALKIRAMFDESLLVFLRPPLGREAEVLKERIQNRGAEDDGQIARRLETASWELTQTSLYDYELVNEVVEETAQQLCEIVATEKSKRLAQ